MCNFSSRVISYLFIYLHTYSFTYSISRVLLEKETVNRLVKKFPESSLLRLKCPPFFPQFYNYINLYGKYENKLHNSQLFFCKWYGDWLLCFLLLWSLKGWIIFIKSNCSIPFVCGQLQSTSIEVHVKHKVYMYLLYSTFWWLRVCQARISRQSLRHV